MENFINAPFGAVNVAGAAKHAGQASTFLLEQNQNNNETGDNQLDDIIDGFFHRILLTWCLKL